MSHNERRSVSSARQLLVRALPLLAGLPVYLRGARDLVLAPEPTAWGLVLLGALLLALGLVAFLEGLDVGTGHRRPNARVVLGASLLFLLVVAAQSLAAEPTPLGYPGLLGASLVTLAGILASAAYIARPEVLGGFR